MSTAIRDHGISQLEFGHGTFMHFVDGFPAEKVLVMPSAHDNHIIWQIGHLAVTNGFFCGCVSAKAWKTSEAENKLFGMNSKPVSDAGMYPSLGEACGMLNESLKVFIGLVKQYDDAALLVNADIDTHGFLKTKMDAIGRNVFHYGWHLGQVSALRRALGLAGKF